MVLQRHRRAEHHELALESRACARQRLSPAGLHLSPRQHHRLNREAAGAPPPRREGCWHKRPAAPGETGRGTGESFRQGALPAERPAPPLPPAPARFVQLSADAGEKSPAPAPPLLLLLPPLPLPPAAAALPPGEPPDPPPPPGRRAAAWPRCPSPASGARVRGCGGGRAFPPAPRRLPAPGRRLPSLASLARPGLGAPCDARRLGSPVGPRRPPPPPCRRAARPHGPVPSPGEMVSISTPMAALARCGSLRHPLARLSSARPDPQCRHAPPRPPDRGLPSCPSAARSQCGAGAGRPGRGRPPPPRAPGGRRGWGAPGGGGSARRHPAPGLGGGRGAAALHPGRARLSGVPRRLSARWCPAERFPGGLATVPPSSPSPSHRAGGGTGQREQRAAVPPHCTAAAGLRRAAGGTPRFTAQSNLQRPVLIRVLNKKI